MQTDYADVGESSQTDDTSSETESIETTDTSVGESNNVSSNTLLDESGKIEVSESQQVDEQKQEVKSEISRPDYWPEDLWDLEKNIPKYEETFKRLSTAEKRTEDLRKALSTKNQAPEEYNLEDIGGDIDKDSAEFKSFTNSAKEAGLSNEQANQLLSKYYTEMNQYQEVAREQEIKKLGEEGKHYIENLQNFANSRLNNKTFSEQEYNAFRNMITTADAARAIGKIIQMTGEQSIPSSVRISNEHASLKDAHQDMVEAIKNNDERAIKEAREKIERYTR